MSSKPKQTAAQRELEQIAIAREKELRVENARQTSKAFSDNLAFRKKLRGIFSLLSGGFAGFPGLGNGAGNRSGAASAAAAGRAIGTGLGSGDPASSGSGAGGMGSSPRPAGTRDGVGSRRGRVSPYSEYIP